MKEKPTRACIYLLLMLLLQAPAGVKAQFQKVDSLLKQVSATKEDTAKVILLVKIGNGYAQYDRLKAIGYYKKAEELGKKIKYTHGVSAYYAAINDMLLEEGRLDSALKINLECLEWAKNVNDSMAIAKALMNVGIVYSYLADFENAIRYCEAGRNLFDRLGNVRYEGQVNDILQNIATSMHQYNKGVAYGLKAVEQLNRAGDTIHLCYAYNNLALNYIELKEYQIAGYYLEQAYLLALAKNLVNIQIFYFLNQGYIALQQGNFEKMRPFLEKGLALSKRHGIPESTALAWWGLSNYFLSTKDYQIAKKYADSALTFATIHNMKQVKVRVLPTLSNIAYAMQDNGLGFGYLQEYQSLNDSILNESVTKNTIAVEKRYESEKKDARIELQKASIRQKSTLNYILAGGTLVLIVFALLSYRNYRHRQKLQQQRISELETEKQLTATEAVLKGEEQERSRLAKDLHDGLGGMLSGIKLSLNNMKGNLIMTAENADAFEMSIGMLDNTIREMRRVAQNMMPEMLVKYGLDTALKELCREISHSTGLQANYQSLDMDKIDVEQGAAIAVYRIVQELSANAIKHSGAKNLLVQVHALPDEKQLAITVEDDGKGFDPQQLAAATGMGWKNIRNRIDFLKGKLDIHSKPGTGTSVLLEINY